MSEKVKGMGADFHGEKKVKGRANTTAAILAVEEILREESGKARTLTAEEIRKKLNEQYSRLFGNAWEISRKAVNNMLQTLEDFYMYKDKAGNVKSRICYNESEKENGSTYRTGYFYEDPGETELDRNKRLILKTIEAEQHFQQNKVKTLSFCYNSYNAEGKFKPVIGQVTVIPLRVIETGGWNYLLAVSPGKGNTKVYHWRIDRMTNLETDWMNFEGDVKKNTLAGYNKTEDEDYLAMHPFMFYESEGNEPTTFIFRIVNVEKKKEKSALNSVSDAFGKDTFKAKYDKKRKTIEIRVRCVPNALKLFLKHNMNCVEFPKQKGQAEKKRKWILGEIQKEFEEFMKRCAL